MFTFTFTSIRESPCLCICLDVCAIGCSFLGLSLVLRSHDQFQASHWSSPPLLPAPVNFVWPLKKYLYIYILNKFFFPSWQGYTNCIGQEIQCLPYAGFFIHLLEFLRKKLDKSVFSLFLKEENLRGDKFVGNIPTPWYLGSGLEENEIKKKAELDLCSEESVFSSLAWLRL